MAIRKTLLVGVFSVLLIASSFAQNTQADKDAAYTRVVTERAAKIVATLVLSDSVQAGRVRTLIAQQYKDLNTIHESQKAAIADLKAKNSDNKEALDGELKKAEATVSEKLTHLHRDYLSKLSGELSSAQIEKVKDGMTYGVLPITYKGYQDMLPNLTEAQKTQILAYLTEARERAMDEGSSEKKHAMFGKYKGRINNYLSAAGIDMKKAGQEWEARRAAEAGKTKN